MDAVARQPELSLQVEEVSTLEGFDALEGEWNALLKSSQDELFYRHDFIRNWLTHFAPSERLRILVARNEAGHLVGVLPLLARRSRLLGLPVRELVSPSNPHSCRFDLIAQDPGPVGRTFIRHLASDPGWDVIRLLDVPEGGSGWGFYHAAKEAGFPAGTWTSLVSPYVRLPATFEELQARLDGKFKANLRRRRKKLEAIGKVELQRIEGGTELDQRLAEGFALEKSGWKGEAGTAIDQDPATRGFYVDLAHLTASSGELSIYLLKVDGRPVAFHYALTHRGRYLLLKPGYDEGLKECSPGQLMMEEVLKDCIRRGLTELDFLGPDMIWKRDWTDQARVHTWLYIFRNTQLGRALCTAKFRWVPIAKEVIARWKGE